MMAPSDGLANLGPPSLHPEVEKLMLSSSDGAGTESSMDVPSAVRPASVVAEVPVALPPSHPPLAVSVHPRPLLVYTQRRRRSRPASPMAAGVGTPGSPVRQFLSGITRPVQQLLPRPAAPRRRSRPRPAGSLPRRSRQIAEAGPCSPGPVLNDVQRRVIKCLGLSHDVEKVSHQALDSYCKLFENPLTDVHLSALAALFGWKVEDGDQARATDTLSVSY